MTDLSDNTDLPDLLKILIDWYYSFTDVTDLLVLLIIQVLSVCLR